MNGAHCTKRKTLVEPEGCEGLTIKTDCDKQVKSMAKDFAKVFYSSRAWKKCRSSFISYRMGIDGGMCQRCHKELGYIVHHKIWLTPQNINDPDISLNWSNLEYVGQDCHNKEHMRKYGITADGLDFDENGNLIETEG